MGLLRRSFLLCLILLTTIVAGAAAQGTNSASMGPVSVPSTMLTGEKAVATVTVTNTGTSIWTAGYKLASLQGHTWSTTEAPLESVETVMPSQSRTFYFEITAPIYPGVYDFQWQMYEDGAGFFGQATGGVQISVAQNSVIPTYGFYEQSLTVNQNIALADAHQIEVVFTGASDQALGQTVAVVRFSRGTSTTTRKAA